jgi:hypothetical protein
MNLRWSVGVQWALMVLVSAFLFVCFFRLNDWLFDSLEYVKGVNWVFLPAGFRVLLVLALGIPGALGIAVGTFWLDMQRTTPPAAEVMLLTCLASGFGPWLVKFWMERRGLLGQDLAQLTSSRLLQFVVAYAAVNAVAHQSIHWFFEQDLLQPWINVWPMFTGDLLGAVIVLYTFKLSLPWLKATLRAKA